MLDQLENAIQHRINSLIDITTKEVITRKLKKVGIIASPTTIKHRLYTQCLQAVGIIVVLPSKKEQIISEELIRRVIANKLDAQAINQLLEIVSRMKRDGCEVVILGCTELSVIIRNQVDDGIIDPLTLVAHQLIEGERNAK